MAPPSSTTSTASYDAAEKWCQQVVARGHDMLFDPQIYLEEIHLASFKFQFPVQSLQSFLRNIHLIYVKKNAHRVKHMVTKSLLTEYHQQGSSIVALAKRINFPPYLLARYMVEAMTTSTDPHRKFNIADAMRYPESKLTRDVIASAYLPSEETFQQPMNDQTQQQSTNTTETNHRPPPSTATATATATTRLALEVRQAMEMDPVYGPLSDKERHLVGVEFEVVLEQELKDFGIPFETEAQLRERGASRTPDVLLSFPIGVQVPKRSGHSSGRNRDDSEEDDNMEWKMVCWIDSKALFGDVNTHHTSVLPQLETYVHRFGPGLVIYWFGHAPLERLGDAQGDVVIVEWDLPSVMLRPDGTTASKPSISFSIQGGTTTSTEDVGGESHADAENELGWTLRQNPYPDLLCDNGGLLFQ